MAEKTEEQLLEEAIQKAKDRIAPNAIIHKLEDIFINVSWGQTQKVYFPDKSVSWIYDRLNGKDKQGNLVEFTEEEKQQFKAALKDLVGRISAAADKI